MGIEGLGKKPQTSTPSRVDAGSAVAGAGQAPPDPTGDDDKSTAAIRRLLGGELVRPSGTAGARGALAGLDAVSRKKKPSALSAAVTGMLLGLTLLGSAMPASAQTQPWLPSSSAIVQNVAEGGPPPLRERRDPEVLRIAQLKNTELPDTIVSLANGARAVHGSDPGDFYCEHAFFTSTSQALKDGSSVARTPAGEVLTGFLHVPSDRFTYDLSGDNAPEKISQAERHADRREIVGAALRGYFELARLQVADRDPVSILLTGYSQWGSVVNNPTGDFVAHVENIDAAVSAGFGVAMRGRVVHQDEGRLRLEYYVAVPEGLRPLVVEAVVLPVTDAAIDGGPQSLQARMGALRPHAVLSMGVAGGSSAYSVEHHADDGGLALRDGKQVHDDAQTPTRSHPENRSLARALLIGNKLGEARIVGSPLVALRTGGGG